MAAVKSFDQNVDSTAVKSSDQNVNSPPPSHLKVSSVPEVLSDVEYSIRFHTENNETDTSTAPRLSRDQIRVLEDHFKKKPKPGTEAKMRLTEQLKLSTIRVNNWVQNRRAKASHQKPKLVPLDAASILDTSGYPMDEEVFRRHFPKIKDERLVSDLHICCIRVLYECRQSPAVISSSFKDLDCDLVDEQLGRLFLWGQGFKPEKLEDALDQSNELREMVLESLCEIGKLIIQVHSSTYLTPLTEALLASKDYLPHRVQELEMLITRAQSSRSRLHELGSDNEEEDAFEDVSSENDVEVSELGVNLDFHVQCLMDLIPSLQQNIAHAEKIQANFSTEKRDLLFPSLNKHMNDPYPKKHEVAELAAQSNLAENQVRDWYTRYRKRNPKRIGHEQSHHSSDASANPIMRRNDGSIVIGESLGKIMEVESHPLSLQETWLSDRSSSSLDTYQNRSNAHSPSELSPESNGHTLQSARRAGSHSPNQPKPRTNFSNEQRQILLSWLDQHMNDPYPKKHELFELATRTNLTENQVRDWYTRYRKRHPKRIGHKQSHHSSDASANPIMTGNDGSIVIGESLGKIMEVESHPPSLQETWLSDRSSSPLDAYLQTSPRDEPISCSTADSLQSDNDLPYFSTRGGHTLRRQGTVPSTRTGAKRTHQLSSQQSGDSVTSNDIMQPPPFAPERQGDKRFQCTVCNRCHQFKSDWIRDEETHNPQLSQIGWICMRQGPLLVCNGDKTCAFCGKSNPTDEHLDSEHNTFLCSQKPVEQRSFKRPDHLHRHMNDSHKAKIETPPKSWRMCDHDSATQQFWCGFCPGMLGTTWKSRLDHIADHYTIDNYDMTRWLPEPRILNEFPILSPAANPDFDVAETSNLYGTTNLNFDGAASQFDDAANPDFDRFGNLRFDDTANPDFDDTTQFSFGDAANPDFDSMWNPLFDNSSLQRY